VSDDLVRANARRLVEGMPRQRAPDATPLHVRSYQDREFEPAFAEAGKNGRSDQSSTLPGT
jgi:hypothetical protein